jgi:hypothetical protein
MPILVTDLAFAISDTPTLLFMEHCFDHWKDTATCTDVHVDFMKHLARELFRLPVWMQLIGIRFEDDILAFFCPQHGQSAFYVLSRYPEWKAVHVTVDGFAPHWGLETGFWEGLGMADSTVAGEENTGPQCDE